MITRRVDQPLSLHFCSSFWVYLSPSAKRSPLCLSRCIRIISLPSLCLLRLLSLSSSVFLVFFPSSSLSSFLRISLRLLLRSRRVDQPFSVTCFVLIHLFRSLLLSLSLHLSLCAFPTRPTVYLSLVNLSLCRSVRSSLSLFGRFSFLIYITLLSVFLGA